MFHPPPSSWVCVSWKFSSTLENHQFHANSLASILPFSSTSSSLSQRSTTRFLIRFRALVPIIILYLLEFAPKSQFIVLSTGHYSFHRLGVFRCTWNRVCCHASAPVVIIHSIDWVYSDAPEIEYAAVPLLQLSSILPLHLVKLYNSLSSVCCLLLFPIRFTGLVPFRRRFLRPLAVSRQSLASNSLSLSYSLLIDWPGSEMPRNGQEGGKIKNEYESEND